MNWTQAKIKQMLPKLSEWVKSLSRVLLFATPWTIAHQAPPSIRFSRQEYWSGLPFPSPGDLPDPGIEPRSLALQADALTSEPPLPKLGACKSLTSNENNADPKDLVSWYYFSNSVKWIFIGYLKSLLCFNIWICYIFSHTLAFYESNTLYVLFPFLYHSK